MTKAAYIRDAYVGLMVPEERFYDGQVNMAVRSRHTGWSSSWEHTSLTTNRKQRELTQKGKSLLKEVHPQWCTYSSKVTTPNLPQLATNLVAKYSNAQDLWEGSHSNRTPWAGPRLWSSTYKMYLSGLMGEKRMGVSHFVLPCSSQRLVWRPKKSKYLGPGQVLPSEAIAEFSWYTL